MFTGHSMSITLDIGGEGRHPEAWNLNLARAKTFGPNCGRPIPRLIVGRGDGIPFADHSVNRVFVERGPLSAAVLREIARVITANGSVELRHVALPGRDRHRLAREILGGKALRAWRRLGGATVQETIIQLEADRLVTAAGAS